MKIKFAIIEDATPEELKRLNLEELFGNHVQIVKPLEEKPEWLNGPQFEVAMAAKGYKMVRSMQKKKEICDEYKVTYEKKGREIYFLNQLDRVPNKLHKQ
jgi:hypothetical protein